VRGAVRGAVRGVVRGVVRGGRGTIKKRNVKK
jgi:hypothetical protein